MKAPKNFYNTVNQSKLGIDDLFTRTAENEADITAIETVVGDDTAGLVKSVSDLETVVGDDTTGLVKSVSDLETVVGDLDDGLVKDVSDLQTASEQYHDDIADLKTADTLINNRIDGHLLAETTTSADEGKIMSVDSNGDWSLTTPPASGDIFTIIGYRGSNATTLYIRNYSTWGAAIQEAIASGKFILCKIYLNVSSTDEYGYYCAYNDNHGDVTFIKLNATRTLSVEQFVVRRNSSNTVTTTQHNYNELPTFSSSDSGKVLSINAGGNLEWVSLT